jgi:hypothetical protein
LAAKHIILTVFIFSSPNLAPPCCCFGPSHARQCYYFNPIKELVARPMAIGMPALKACEKMAKSNPEICEVRFPVKVDKTSNVEDFKKMKVKALKKILTERGEKCSGCTEKADYVKRVMETMHKEL